MIQNYNSALAFALMGTKLTSIPGRGTKVFRVHGQIYHNTSAIHHDCGSNPSYSQLYILDASDADEHRINFVANKECDPALMRQLASILRQINPYAKIYKQMRDVELEEQQLANQEGRPSFMVQMIIHVDRRCQDLRRYNAPTSNEIAFVFKTADGLPPPDIPLFGSLIIPQYGKNLIRIDPSKPMCDPMVYPIMFPSGDQGYSLDLQLMSDTTRRTYSTSNNEEDEYSFSEEDSLLDGAHGPKERSRVTHRQFYSYRLHERDDGFNAPLHCGKLTQQYMVDSFVKMESNNLKYIKNHQQNLRVAHYKGLTDYVQRRSAQTGTQFGIPIILPSSFIGSPRAMHQNYQDAMAIVAKFGRPTYFITITCNPQWPEIQRNLGPGEYASDRPDLCVRVFYLYLKEIEQDIMEKKVFGTVVSKIHVIEFQKRGLPHAHMLVTIASEDEPKSPQEIDNVISAELPDQQLCPRLHEAVRKFMIHGPCGSYGNKHLPCVDEAGNCQKMFPKEFNDETIENPDGFPIYRRCNDGKTVDCGAYRADNRWVVPFNKYLLLKYYCHINVEMCASIQAIKYVYKYVYKGHDCANVQMTATSKPSDQSQGQWDEIKIYILIQDT